MSIVFLIAVVLTIADVAGIHSVFSTTFPLNISAPLTPPPSIFQNPYAGYNLLLVIYYTVTGFNVLLLRGG